MARRRVREAAQVERDKEDSGTRPLVVCLLDVLGFEGILKDLGLAALNSKYARLIKYVEKQAGYGIHIVPVGGHLAVGGLQIDTAYFSDTILFWTVYSELSLPTFTQLMADAICFSVERGLPLRGAITVGDLILDKATGTFLGEPLVEADRTEREQQWIGISFGPSFMLPPRNQGFHLDTVLPFKSHYKVALSQYATGMTVDWPRKWRETRKRDVRPLIKALDKSIQHAVYYWKTLAFVDFSEQNHDWFTHKQHLDFG